MTNVKIDINYEKYMRTRCVLDKNLRFSSYDLDYCYDRQPHEYSVNNTQFLIRRHLNF